jgi:hypothetical protein
MIRPAGGPAPSRGPSPRPAEIDTRTRNLFFAFLIAKEIYVDEDRMLKWFKFDHLPPHLQPVSAGFWDLAFSLCALVESGPERTVALRKLLEAKDAAVRAKVNPGG